MAKKLVFQFYDINRLLCNAYDDLSVEYFFKREDAPVSWAICPRSGRPFKEFYEERVFPRTRVDCKRLLMQLGLNHYDEEDIVRASYGLMVDDYNWIRFADSDASSYEEACKLFDEKTKKMDEIIGFNV